MSHFIVSFRIAETGTYQQRYDSLRKKVNEISSGYVWDETTSVYIFSAPGSAESVAHTLYVGTDLNLTLGDILLVVDPIKSEYAGFGIKYGALLSAAIGMQPK